MVKAYGFAIGKLPHPLFHPREAKKTVKMLKGLEGLIGIHQHPRGATILFFDDLNEAKRARNVICGTGRPVGTHIMECERNEDLSEMRILRPAEE